MFGIGNAKARPAFCIPTARTPGLRGRSVQLCKRLRRHAEIAVDLQVDGMTCKHCSASVEKTLQDDADVVNVTNVDLESGIASIVIDAASPEDAQEKLPALCQKIQGIGFNAAPAPQS